MATIRQRQSTYAITISTYKQHRHFQKSANAELLIATLFRYKDQNKFQLHGFAIMPDHVHVLLTPAINQTTARCAQLIKGGYSFAVHQGAEVWHIGYHDHRIRDFNDYTNQLAYIAANPIRKHLENYPHVHTNELYRAKLDPQPQLAKEISTERTQSISAEVSKASTPYTEAPILGNRRLQRPTPMGQLLGTPRL